MMVLLTFKAGVDLKQPFFIVPDQVKNFSKLTRNRREKYEQTTGFYFN